MAAPHATQYAVPLFLVPLYILIQSPIPDMLRFFLPSMTLNANTLACLLWHCVHGNLNTIAHCAVVQSTEKEFVMPGTQLRITSITFVLNICGKPGPDINVRGWYNI